MPSSSPQLGLPADLAKRLRQVCREEGGGPRAETLEALAEGFELDRGGADRQSQEAFRDRLSTQLMDCYRATASSVAFGLLYEINYRLFFAVISARLRKFYFHLDPNDVLQEVFFNIYRYPHRFEADKDRAFRHWAGMIIRNTVYKFTREKDRLISVEVADEDLTSRPDRSGRSPLVNAIRVESQEDCARAYFLYLRLYLGAYLRLSEREQHALHRVEVEGWQYRDTAAELGIRIENLKMVIFRARKKILRRLDRAMVAAESWAPAAGSSRRDRRGAQAPQATARATIRGQRPHSTAEEGAG